MKKITLTVILVTLLVPKTNAQNKGAGAIGAVAGLAAIGGIFVAIDRMEEQAELKATE